MAHIAVHTSQDSVTSYRSCSHCFLFKFVFLLTNVRSLLMSSFVEILILYALGVCFKSPIESSCNFGSFGCMVSAGLVFFWGSSSLDENTGFYK